MGWFETTNGGVCGDGPSDIMGDAIDRIVEEYKKEWGREPTAQELVDTFRFSSGHLENEETVDEIRRLTGGD